MATVPSGTRFIGIATDVDLKERGSALLNKRTEPFTIEDIKDYIGGLSYTNYVTEVNYSPFSLNILNNTTGKTFTWVRTGDDDVITIPSTLADNIYISGTASLGLYGSLPSLAYQITQSGPNVVITIKGSTNMGSGSLLSKYMLEIRIY